MNGNRGTAIRYDLPMPSAAALRQVRAEFDRIAALTPESPQRLPLEKWITDHLPTTRGRLLDIGCGVGDLARRLAPRFTTVDAIDLSEGMIAEARRRTPPDMSIELASADMFDWLRRHPSSYDCIVTVATLHHVDLAAALAAMAAALVPGGKLLVIDLYDRPGLRHLPVNAVALLLNVTREWVATALRRSSLELRQAYRAHGKNETYLELGEVKAVANAVLPGAEVRGTLFWRYTLCWRKGGQVEN